MRESILFKVRSLVPALKVNAVLLVVSDSWAGRKLGGRDLNFYAMVGY